MPRSLAVLTTTLAAALAAAAGTAHAAAPFTAGSGLDPDVAVSAAGTGHVVWTTPDPGQVGYCRVPAGAASCDVTTMLAFPGGASAHENGAFAFTPSATKVVVVAGCWACGGGGITDRVFRWISLDGGASFGAATEITGASSFDLSSGHGAWLDDANLFLGVGGSKLRAMPPAADATVTHSSFFTNYGPDVARVPGTSTLVTAVNDLETVRYAVYSGPGLTANALNAQANWSVPQDLPAPEGDNEASGLSAGPSGLYLHYRWFVPNDNHVGLRRFDPAAKTFGAPRYLEGDDPIDDAGADDPDTTVDGSGRVHAVWRSLYDAGRLRYTVSDPTGTTFTTPATLAKHEPFQHPRVAAGPDGHGFAVWTGIGGGSVRVVALDPQPESAATGGGAGTPPAPTTTPPSTPPTPSRTPPARRTAKATVPGASLAFGVPAACVAPGRTFTVTLTWKKQRRKGNVFVKVRRADFFIGAKRVKIDTQAPFRQTLRVTASAKAGSTIGLRARAFIKVKRGTAPTKSLRTTIRVCGGG